MKSESNLWEVVFFFNITIILGRWFDPLFIQKLTYWPISTTLNNFLTCKNTHHSSYKRNITNTNPSKTFHRKTTVLPQITSHATILSSSNILVLRNKMGWLGWWLKSGYFSFIVIVFLQFFIYLKTGSITNTFWIVPLLLYVPCNWLFHIRVFDKLRGRLYCSVRVLSFYSFIIGFMLFNLERLCWSFYFIFLLIIIQNCMELCFEPNTTPCVHRYWIQTPLLFIFSFTFHFLE